MALSTSVYPDSVDYCEYLWFGHYLFVILLDGVHVGTSMENKWCCGICLENIVDIDVNNNNNDSRNQNHWCFTECGHLFHRECILTWFAHQPGSSKQLAHTCPICRGSTAKLVAIPIEALAARLLLHSHPNDIEFYVTKIVSLYRRIKSLKSMVNDVEQQLHTAH